MIDFATVKQAAQGRWPAILTSHGIHDNHLTGKHGPCPGCGGKDRFRYVPADPNGKWFCGQGGDPIGGDGFDLLCHVHGFSKFESLKAVASFLGVEGDNSPQAQAKAKAIIQQQKRHTAEKTLAHELHVLFQVVSSRVASRELARDRKFLEARPDWQPMPEGSWQREREAVKRIRQAMGVLYER